MTKNNTADAQRHNAELQLFNARRGLAHLVQMYESGRWSQYYKKETAFAEAVREARQAVDHWNNVVSRLDGGATS